MRRFFSIISTLFLMAGVSAQSRFPKPDFESGYQYPDISYAMPNEKIWLFIDIFLLVGLMSFVAWAILKKQTRKPIIWVSIISVAYFGFIRTGCVCSIGAVQNVALAMNDHTYILPVTVLLFFILPILFGFLFGRVFCAGVCPFGALQDLVHTKNYRLSRAVTSVLSIIPWVYLIFAVLYAVTRSNFIICRFDPFIGIFRMGGDFGLILFGSLLLLASVFTGRPFCRFICPYGAVLSLFSRVSVWKVQITKQNCINCELCHNACPVDAIRAPYENKVKEKRVQGVQRLLMYFVVLPLIIAALAFIMRNASDDLSRAHKDVRLYDMVRMQETNPQDSIPLELETFYSMGGEVDTLQHKVEVIKSDYTRHSTAAGAIMGLVIGLMLIRLSVKRSREKYGIEYDNCVGCGRCFSYCPQNINSELNGLKLHVENKND